MSTHKLILFFFCTIISQLIFAQGNPAATDSLRWISRNPRIDQVINKLKEINSKKQTIPGYRLQVYFGTQRSRANELRASFNSRFPEINATVSYNQPNFKVRAGDFRTRLEAQKYLAEVEKTFPGAFVVPDEIRLPPLK